MKMLLCRPKILDPAQLENAQRRAVEINPANAAERRTVEVAEDRRGGPRRIVIVTARKWQSSGVKLSVSFLDGEKQELRRRILRHMNAWSRDANISFVETGGVGEVRIARLKSPPDMAGYWSYIGTEILEARADEPTMNLEGFTMRTPEAEFRRVVRHETGHTLGFEHEHMRTEIVDRIVPGKAYSFFARNQGWSRIDVDQQVLTPLSKKSIMGTQEADPVSIMCYDLPASIMRDRKPVKGGSDINERDYAFAARLYPRRGRTISSESEMDIRPSPTAPFGVVARSPELDAPNLFEIVVMDDFRPDQAGGARMSMPKFARVFASYSGARVTASLRLRADARNKTLFPAIIGTQERIKNYTNRVRGSLPSDEELRVFGTRLFDTLFQGDVRRLYDEARTRQQRRLDLVFTSMIPWIAEKPWEFAYDAGRGSFLATEDVRFTRNVLTAIPADPIVKRNGPLRILVASAQPVGFGRLSIEEETAVIRRGFEPLEEAGLVTIETLTRVTPSRLHGFLDNGDFQVVHFIGHGVFDEKRGQGCLVFVDEQGTEAMLGERSVREIFCGRNLSLVFLNACETGRGGGADFNKGVAQSLVAHGLPALVANQYSVLDSSATFFAQHFYWALSQGASLGQAARESRIAVNYSLRGEPIDWAVPVLYARDPNLGLCPEPAQRQRMPITRVRASVRRSTRAHSKRIAVWDMDNVFPALDSTLATMSTAQRSFGFRLAELSVPLDVWDLSSNGGTTYLWAERLEERLRGAPMELGVDLLACITRHWMRSDDWLNIYGFTAAKGEPPISILSVAGFDQLPVRGRETDRVIANLMTAALAEYFGDAQTHAKGNRRCPLHFNQQRSYAHLAERQRFDAGCRAQLRKQVGTELASLEILLNLFT